MEKNGKWQGKGKQLQQQASEWKERKRMGQIRCSINDKGNKHESWRKMVDERERRKGEQ